MKTEIVSIQRFEANGRPWAEIEAIFPVKGRKFIGFEIDGDEDEAALRTKAEAQVRDCEIVWDIA